MDLLLDNGVPLDHTTHVGSRSLLDVLLNVMHDVLVDLTMNNGLHLSDSVVSHGFLDDGSTRRRNRYEKKRKGRGQEEAEKSKEG